MCALTVVIVDMKYLLENDFEYLDGGEWKPFGIEE